jgi:hypothetical protein
MTTLNGLKFPLAGLIALATFATGAQAATRTWVSGTGDDLFPCSRTAPCKTFAGAISKTDAGGEISVLDPGGYGAVTITKSITINGEGTLASILANSGSGITVNADPSDKVVLRNLSIEGAVGGTIGVRVISGNVVIDKCLISGFQTGFVGGVGVHVNASATTNVAIVDTNLVNNSHGVWYSTSSGFVIGTLDNVRILGASGFGVVAGSGTFISVTRSVINGSGSAALLTNASGATINASDGTLSNNGTAAHASSSGSTISLSNMALFGNTATLTTGAGATMATANNNKASGNGGPAPVTNGLVTNF